MDQRLSMYALLSSFCFILIACPDNLVLASRIKLNNHKWRYTGEDGPSHWGGICQLGKRQSPINIVTSNVREDSFTPLSFGDNYSTELNFEAQNNGHTLIARTPNVTQLPTFQGGGLDGKYVFEQLHFHWGSEHLIDGERAALEIHLVHFNSKYGNIKVASREHDGLSVIAILCDESDESDSELEEFLQNALFNVGETANHHPETDSYDVYRQSDLDKHKLNFILRNLLPENVEKWYRYEGSLTTPGCDESVSWIILLQRLHVSSKTLSSLRKLRTADGEEMTINYRPVQDLNGRVVHLQVDESENEAVSDEDKTKTSLSNKIQSSFPKLSLLCVHSVVCILFTNRI